MAVCHEHSKWDQNHLYLFYPIFSFDGSPSLGCLSLDLANSFISNHFPSWICTSVIYYRLFRSITSLEGNLVSRAFPYLQGKSPGNEVIPRVSQIKRSPTAFLNSWPFIVHFSRNASGISRNFSTLCSKGKRRPTGTSRPPKRNCGCSLLLTNVELDLYFFSWTGLFESRIKN